MTVDDPSGTVAIYKRGRYGLYADDHGLTYRLVFGTRRALIAQLPFAPRFIDWGTHP